MAGDKFKLATEVDLQTELPNNIDSGHRPMHNMHGKVMTSGKNRNKHSVYSLAMEMGDEKKDAGKVVKHGNKYEVKYDNNLGENKNLNRTPSYNQGDPEHTEYDNNLQHNRNIWRPYPHESNQGESDHTLSDGQLETFRTESRHYAKDYHCRHRQQLKEKKRLSRLRCRAIKIGLSITLLIVLGVMAFFILRSLVWKDSQEVCDKLTTVENGNVSMSDGSKSVLHCNEGHGPQGSVTITCEDGKWSTLHPCPLVDCGPFPTVANGRIDGDRTTFGETARLQCDPGYMLSATVTFTCPADGNWTNDIEPLCIPHPCGIYTWPVYVMGREDFSHINMTVIADCREGFVFANESDTFIICENGTWKNSPRCEVPGDILLETQNTTELVAGSPFSISCQVTDSPNWNTILLARTDSNSSREGENPIIIATNYSGRVSTEPLDSDLDVIKEVVHLQNGVILKATFNQVQCRDGGIYFCTVMVGERKENSGNKTTRRHFSVIDKSSEIEGFDTTTVLTQGDELVVRCTGKLGTDHDRRKQATLSIKITYRNESVADTLPSVIQSSEHQNCQIYETINSSIWVENKMDGAELQCLLESNNGQKQKSSVLLNVKTTSVHISTPSSSVFVGENFSISTELNHIRGWEVVEIRKVCNDEQVVVARQAKVNETASSLKNDDHIELLNLNMTDTRANIDLYFNGSRCSDACGRGGEIVYISAVKLTDSWVEESTIIEFQVKPTAPFLASEQVKFYRGQEAVIVCTANVGIPGRKLIMKQDSAILHVRSLTNKTEFNEETCENVTTLQYPFTVTDKEDGSVFSCETSTDEGTLTSNRVTVNVSDAVLYFTEESMTGEVGSSVTIQCVVESVANLTSVVITRFSNALCEVSVSEQIISGNCTEADELTVVGSYSENDTIFTTTMTLRKVTCENEGLYACRTNTAKTEMNFKVTSNPTQPYLRLPETLVEDQMTLWEDQLNCTAELGYPKVGQILKIQIKYRESSSYLEYSQNIFATATGCKQNSSISLRQQTFLEIHNGSMLRCVIVDKDDVIIASSKEHSIRLLKNVCGSVGEYEPHPFNCRRYIRCIGDRLYDLTCADGSCAKTDSDSHHICNSYDCSNCG